MEKSTNVEFSDDVLLEILIKLPTVSVFKFKSVSKNWLSLISDASFTSRYVSQSPDPFIFVFQIHCFKETLAFVCTDKTRKNITTSPFPSDRFAGLKIASTINDLILYQSDYHQPAYSVANPFTGQCVRLPLRRRRQGFGCPKAGLISHLKKGSITGYSVVRLIKECVNGEEQRMQIETFSSEKGECTCFRPRNVNLDALRFDSRPCVVFKEALHWMCNRTSAILACDPRGPQQCRVIEVPNEVYHVNGMNAVVGTSCGNLYYFEMGGICLEVDKRFPRWKLWLMREYGKGEWRLEKEGREREMEGVVGNFLSTHSPLHPIAFHPCRKDILVYFWHEGYILTFDTTKGWFEDKLSLFSPAGVVSSWEIHPLFMPLCSTQIPHANMGGVAVLNK